MHANMITLNRKRNDIVGNPICMQGSPPQQAFIARLNVVTGLVWQRPAAPQTHDCKCPERIFGEREILNCWVRVLSQPNPGTELQEQENCAFISFSPDVDMLADLREVRIYIL